MDKRLAKDALLMEVLATFSYSVIGSVKEFDDLYSKLLNLVHENIMAFFAISIDLFASFQLLCSLSKKFSSFGNSAFTIRFLFIDIFQS